MSAHIKVTVDGKVRMDGNLGDWTADEPPDIELIKPYLSGKAHPNAWMRKVMDEIADAATTGRSRRIAIKTRDKGSYSLDVEYV
jgi:hypothetical protein